MCKCCNGLKANNSHRYDPTRTTTLRNKFVAEVNRRYTWLQKEVKNKVVTEDFFGLSLVTNVVDFSNRGISEKVITFNAWLQSMIGEGIMQNQNSAGRLINGSLAWQNKYIRDAYMRGVTSADIKITNIGMTPANDPFASNMHFLSREPKPLAGSSHEAQVNLLYSRSEDDLISINHEMSKQSSRLLAEGLAKGLTAIELANLINDRIEKIGKVRARHLARTEVVRAHHIATIERYRDIGINEVEADVEFVTAGDEKVCPECSSLSGKVFKLDDILFLIPVHPNCRCSTRPIAND